MKRVILIVTLVLTLLVGVGYAQFNAGFLDGPGNVSNPVAFTTSGWYCIDNQPWPAQPNIVAGPFQAQPDCNGY